jgi:hypothetical protein
MAYHQSATNSACVTMLGNLTVYRRSQSKGVGDSIVSISHHHELCYQQGSWQQPSLTRQQWPLG